MTSSRRNWRPCRGSFTSFYSCPDLISEHCKFFMRFPGKDIYLFNLGENRSPLLHWSFNFYCRSEIITLPHLFLLSCKNVPRPPLDRAESPEAHVQGSGARTKGQTPLSSAGKTRVFRSEGFGGESHDAAVFTCYQGMNDFENMFLNLRISDMYCFLCGFSNESCTLGMLLLKECVRFKFYMLIK
jgi:hypothetical protein